MRNILEYYDLFHIETTLSAVKNLYCKVKQNQIKRIGFFLTGILNLKTQIQNF